MPLKLNKKNLTLIFTATLLIFAYFLDGNKTETEPATKSQSSNTVASTSISHTSSTPAVAGDKISPSDQLEPINNPSNKAQAQDHYFTVVKVVDGDTFEVLLDGKVEKLRLIGINTPETVDPRRQVECFGKEASNYAKQLLSGKKVKLAGDTSQDTRDKYGRLLVYAWLEDGTLFNQAMISQGYAYEYTYKTPYLYQAEFKNSQKKAQDAKLGLWSPATCNGQK